MVVNSRLIATNAAGVMGPLAHRSFTAIIYATTGLALFYGQEILRRLSLETALPVAAGLFAGILSADLVTGVVHWACDTWGDEETPLVGASLIYSFREHHRDPKAMLNHDWVEVSGHAALAVAGAFGALLLIDLRLGIRPTPTAHAWLWSMLCFSAITNQLHYWAHQDRPPSAVRVLQRARIILTPGLHADHHRAPHTNGYCITTGWLNGTLDALHFWRGLERIIAIATGAEARCGETKGS